MGEGKYWLNNMPIPEGLQIYEDQVEVAGIRYRRDDAAAFASESSAWIEFELEPDNSEDPNAIRVIACNNGLFGTKRRLIGYVPANLAAVLAATGLLNDIRPRLYNTYVGDSGYINVLFQVLGPKSRIGDYRKARFGDERGNKASPSEGEVLAHLKEIEKPKDFATIGVGASGYLYLAKMYRKQKRYADEVAVLERYDRQRKAPGAAQRTLADRLVRARSLLAKKTGTTA